MEGWSQHGYRQGCYRYLYTGAVSLQFSDLARVAALAQHLELGPLHRHLTQVPHLAGPLHTQVTPCQEVGAGLGSLPPHTHTDVVFRLEDGAVAAHKVTTASPRDTWHYLHVTRAQALLAARSDVLAAMFSNNFIEGAAAEVRLPGVHR